MRLSLRSPSPSERRWDEPPGYKTPIEQVWSLWNTHPDARVLAYVCSCFAELSYLHLTDRELDDAGRYKAVPSLAFQALAASRVSFDVQSTRDLDFPSFVFSTDQYVYAGFRIGDLAMVAIRGTQSFKDWGVNLLGWKQQQVGAGGLHFGFAQEARRATPMLLQHLRNLGGAEVVLFTGHSLGGAIAACLHLQWTVSRTFRTRQPIVFGAPRFADAAAAARLQPAAYRMPLDLVPHLPPRWLGYADTGAPPVMIPEQANRSWPSGWASARAWLPRPGGLPFARHHAMELYRRHLGVGIAPNFPDLVYWEFAQQVMRGETPKTWDGSLAAPRSI